MTEPTDCTEDQNNVKPSAGEPSDICPTVRTKHRYPLLIHPEDVGSRAPLDPVEARACRRLRASEVLDVAVIPGYIVSIGDGVWHAVGAAIARGRYPEHSWGTLTPVLRCPEPEAVAVLLAAGRDPAALAAAIDRVLQLDAWVCEGDEPADGPLERIMSLERAREAAEHFTSEDFDRMLSDLGAEGDEP